MNARAWIVPAVLCWAALCWTVSYASAGEKDSDKDAPPADLPDLTESSKLADLMPSRGGGVVYLDRNANRRADEGEGLEGVRVTDGVGFVRCGPDGRYAITIEPDPLVPYLPSRTVSVCWPDGTWPARDRGTGRWTWWKRLKDVDMKDVKSAKDKKAAEKVDFRLEPRESTLPLCVAFGTDPHDAMRRPQNYVFRDEVARAGKHVDFAVMGADLGYMHFRNAERDYASVEQYTNGFPVMLLHCIGNHDVVGVHGRWWSVPHELAGYGAFTKHLGPARWSFDCAGIHVVGMDWLLADEKGHMQCGLAESAIDWLDEDLSSVPEGTPVYFFNHQPWSPHKRFFEVCSKRGVKLCLGGHSHRNVFLGDHGGVEYWTKMSLYTLVYIDESGFEFVDRCIYRGGRNGWGGPRAWSDWHHNRRGCALYTDRAAEEKERGEHAGLADVTLESASRSIGPLEPVRGPTYDIRVGAKGVGDRPARRFGLRIAAAGGMHEFVYDDVNDMLDLMGRRTYFDPAIPFARVSKATDAVDPDEQTWIEMRVYVMPDRVRVIVNSRLHYQKFVKLGSPEKIEVFAEDGAAEFARVDVRRRTWPADWKRRRTANTG